MTPLKKFDDRFSYRRFLKILYDVDSFYSGGRRWHPPQAASALSNRTSRETPLLLHLKRLPPSLHGLTFPELFFNPTGQPKRQLTSSERLALEELSPDLRDLYLNDSGSSTPRRCFALVRGEELLFFAVEPDRLLSLGFRPAASMGDRSLFVSCDRPLLERLFSAPLWEGIAALDPSEELLIAESSPMGAPRSWTELGKEEALLAFLLRAFPDLRSEVDLNAPGSRRRIALHRAVLAGKVEDATALIEAGAERDPKDLDGKTPLHLAAVQGDLPMVEALLGLGCDPLARTYEGENLLHLAVSKESPPSA